MMNKWLRYLIFLQLKKFELKKCHKRQNYGKGQYSLEKYPAPALAPAPWQNILFPPN